MLLYESGPIDADDCVVYGPQEEEGQAGDQDQEEKRWNKRTQQMLHGLQVQKKLLLCTDYFENRF